MVAIVGPVAAMRAGGYVTPATKAPLGTLSTWQAVVIERAAARILAPDEAGTSAAAAPTPADLDVVGFVDRYVGTLPGDLRRDLLRLVAYLEHGAPLAAGHASRFTKLDAASQDQVLESLQSSRVGLLQGGFDAFRCLIFMAYYRDPSTWAIPGYDGPWVDRPQGGWH